MLNLLKKIPDLALFPKKTEAKKIAETEAPTLTRRPSEAWANYIPSENDWHEKPNHLQGLSEEELAKHQDSMIAKVPPLRRTNPNPDNLGPNNNQPEQAA